MWANGLQGQNSGHDLSKNRGFYTEFKQKKYLNLLNEDQASNVDDPCTFIHYHARCLHEITGFKKSQKLSKMQV